MQFFGEEKGTALVRAIAANLKPVLTDGRLAMARSVGAGEYLLALNNFVNLSINVKLAGEPIDFFPLDPVPLYLCAGRGQCPGAGNPERGAACRQFHAQPGMPGVLHQIRAAADARRRRHQSARHRRAGSRRSKWSPRCSIRRKKRGCDRPSIRCFRQR